MTTWPVSCTQCGTALEEGPEVPLEERSPCPSCGSSARTVHVSAEDQLTFTDEITGLDITSAPGARPWQEMWSLVQHGLTVLEDYYAQHKAGSSTALQASIYSFFTNCYQLKDHLKSDRAVSASTQGKVENFVHGSGVLSLAGDIANTHKHHTRLPASARSPRIGSMSLVGVAAAIDWTDPGTQAAYSMDALDLARECVAEWTAFLTQEGLI